MPASDFCGRRNSITMKHPTSSPYRILRQNIATGLLAAALVVVAGCAIPISARKTAFSRAYRSAHASALTGSSYSSEARLVLYRFDLLDKYEEFPEEALRELHERASVDQRRDVLYALAELNYAQGENLERNRGIKLWVPKPARDYFLSSAVYAYLYLFGSGTEKPAGPFEPQFRPACNLYNYALARAFIDPGSTNDVVKLEAEERVLPAGNIKIEVVPIGGATNWFAHANFYSADGFLVRGLSVHNSRGGLGATLVGVMKESEGLKMGRHIPATLILRGPKDIKEWNAGQATVTLEVSSGYQQRMVELAGQQIPVRTDTTTPLAFALNNTWFWEIGRQQFFSTKQIIKNDVYQMQPYEPGKIPVVFIHGTFSTPTWWAEMANSLQAYPVIGSRYQLWYYIYNSGNPILFTAANFRTSLTNTVQRLDPDRQDPALQQMVLIGHSQGGLLAKLAAVDTQNKLWQAVSDAPFDQVDLSPEYREELGHRFFFNSVPEVKRVIFVATPHRGSYQITMFVQNLIARFVSLPRDLLQVYKHLGDVLSASKLPPELRGMPSSVAGMSPKNPVLQVLADMPPAPGIKAHSIIAVKSEGDPKLGSDGVVKYSSAHVPYVESELIVKSGHTVQTKPAAIEEVRRILLEHLNSLPLGTNAAKL